MKYIGKSIAMFGLFIIMCKYFLVVFGIMAGEWLYFVGVIIVIIGAVIHVMEKDK